MYVLQSCILVGYKQCIWFKKGSLEKLTLIHTSVQLYFDTCETLLLNLELFLSLPA